MGIRDNTYTIRCESEEEKKNLPHFFWRHCWKYHSNVFEVYTLCLDTSSIRGGEGAIRFIHMRCRVQKVRRNHVPLSPSASWTIWIYPREHPSTYFFVHQGMWLISSIVWHDRTMQRMKTFQRNAKCRFCDDFFFFGSHTNPFMITKYRYIENFVDESDQYDLSSEETRLRFTQPAIWNASTGRRVCWLWVSHWRQEQTQADHVVLSSRVSCPCHWYPTLSLSRTTREQRGIFAPPLFIGLDSHNCRARVKEYLFDELPTRELSEHRDFCATTVCPFCHKKLDNDKVRHLHAHVTGEYTPQEKRGGICSFKAGQVTFAPVVPSVTCNSPSTRRTIDCQSTFTMDRHYDFTFHHWEPMFFFYSLIKSYDTFEQ